VTSGEIQVLQAELTALRGDLHEATRELKESHQRIEAESRERLARIEEQTRLHNGRMTSAEKQLATLKGGLLVLATLIPFATAVVVQYLP
jgi:hypothetical protein